MKIILSTFVDFEVLAAVEDGVQAVAYCETHRVDVALLDVQMPIMNGVEATKEITERTATKVLILTTFDHDAYILDAVKFGAKGYLLKNNEPERIREAIISIYHGHSVLQDTVLEKLKENLIAERPNQGENILKIDTSLFTEREREIMLLISRGLSNKEISKSLFLSEGTIANHISTILSKSGLKDRTQIAIYCLKGDLA
jgi:DNA-binding NarL/FixJ family response regulator